MDASKLDLLNNLFEKSVEQNISRVEMNVLRHLYEEFICEGRVTPSSAKPKNYRSTLRIAS